MSYLGQYGWGWLPSSRINIVSGTWRCTKWIWRFIRIVDPTYHPLTGHVSVWSAFGKEKWYVWGSARGGGLLMISLVNTMLELVVIHNRSCRLLQAGLICQPIPHHMSHIGLLRVSTGSTSGILHHPYCIRYISLYTESSEELCQESKYRLNPLQPRRDKGGIVGIEKRCYPLQCTPTSPHTQPSGPTSSIATTVIQCRIMASTNILKTVR